MKGKSRGRKKTTSSSSPGLAVKTREIHDELAGDEKRFDGFFEENPIAQLELDGTRLKTYIDELRKDGIKNFNVYFRKNASALQKCVDLIKIKRVNKAAVRLFNAKSRKHLIENMAQSVKDVDGFDTFRNNVVALTKGLTHFEGERTFRSFTGKRIYVRTTWHIPSEFEDSLVTVYNSHVDITERRRLEEALIASETELKNKTEKLEAINATLNILLENRTKDKKEMEETMLYNVRELILPYLEKLKETHLDERQKTYLGIVERNLSEIMSPFLRGMSLSQLKFSRTELKVIDLIKEGFSTRQIADFFNLSTRTVECHRDSIRGKLNIKNQKINLRTYLLSKC